MLLLLTGKRPREHDIYVTVGARLSESFHMLIPKPLRDLSPAEKGKAHGVSP